MTKPTTFDPGLTQQYAGVLRRAINKDGSFNVARRGGSWRDIHPYLHMLNMGWPSFFGVVFLVYVIVNTLFAALYFLMGPGHLQGADSPDAGTRFLKDFFFSAHTLTTVGYGNIYPSSTEGNTLASLEALTGLLVIALATGLLFGRFSRPSARLSFSERILIAPYQESSSVQFRILNLRPNILVETEATLILMTVDGGSGVLQRKFEALKLERNSIYFLALAWTIVHPIDETSPLYGKTQEDLERLQAEFLILIKGFDDTFSQIVHTRYSYRYDEISWGAKFRPTFEIDEAGDMVLNVDRVGQHTILGPESLQPARPALGQGS